MNLCKMAVPPENGGLFQSRILRPNCSSFVLLSLGQARGKLKLSGGGLFSKYILYSIFQRGEACQ